LANLAKCLDDNLKQVKATSFQTFTYYSSSSSYIIQS